MIQESWRNFSLKNINLSAENSSMNLCLCPVSTIRSENLWYLLKTNRNGKEHERNLPQLRYKDVWSKCFIKINTPG